MKEVLSTFLLAIPIIAILEALKHISPALSYVVAALAFGFYVGRLYEAGHPSSSMQGEK